MLPMDESGFWKYLQKGMGARWKAERVENRLAAGFPDVFFTINGTHGLVELKYLPKKRKTVTISHFTDEQRAFSFRHSTPILIQIQDEYYLFGSEHSLHLGTGEVWDEFVQKASGHWQKKIDFDHLARCLLVESNKG